MTANFMRGPLKAARTNIKANNKTIMEKIPNFQENVPEWVRPDFKEEKGKLERVTRDFLQKEPNTQNVDEIVKIMEDSPVVELSDADWELLENTDSFHNIKVGQIEEARKICQRYNEVLEEKNKRDFDNLLNNFLQDNKMECPTILKNQEGKLHLINGNTRLMISRALGVLDQKLLLVRCIRSNSIMLR